MSTMTRNNIPLPNLSLIQKTLFSSAILLALSLYVWSWSNIINSIYYSDNVSNDKGYLGITLGVLASDNYIEYEKLFLTHSISLIALIIISLFLFYKTSLRRRAKFLLCLVTILLVVLDISAWIKAPTCSSTNLYVGLLGILAGIPLLIIATIPLYQMWIYKRWKSIDGNKKRVVIVGGGFAGLYTALGLNKKLGYNHDLEITLIDKNNYFLFPPLLPSAAAGSIETRQVTYPFRRIFETTNIVFRKATVQKIEPDKNTLSAIIDENNENLEINYNYLILSPGSVTQTFGTKGALEHAIFMREINDAISLRNQVINNFEKAATLKDKEKQKELLRFVIVGAGPTGIETATEIQDLIKHILLKRYSEIDPSIPEVCIVQSGEQILPGWPEDIIRTTQKQLNKMQIKLYLKSRVSEVTENFVSLSNGETILNSKTIVWCAGVKPNELLTRSSLPLHSSGRVLINNDLRTQEFNNVFVLGDAAYLVDKKTGQALPPLGQVAFQQGSFAARNLVRLLTGKTTKSFSYFNFGGLVSVGEHFAAVNLLGIRFSGFIGWFIWRSLYFAKLVGISTKIRVLIDWTLDLVIERSITQIESKTKI
jgi:NADH:ubiquinone reductase (H+-translocating)